MQNEPIIKSRAKDWKNQSKKAGQKNQKAANTFIDKLNEQQRFISGGNVDVADERLEKPTKLIPLRFNSYYESNLKNLAKHHGRSMQKEIFIALDYYFEKHLFDNEE